MASFALIDFAMTINSVNLSDHNTKATLNVKVDDLENTAFGTSGWKTRLGGLKEFSLSLEFNQDFAASNVDATLWAALGTVVAFTGKATSGANSATNPQYSGSVLISEYTPFDNSVGELAKVSVTFPGSGALARATS
jgi:hypothetical protein